MEIRKHISDLYKYDLSIMCITFMEMMVNDSWVPTIF
jgi:hypothetical protein